MAGNRSGVLRSVHKLLEQHAGLRTVLGHTQGATSIAGGARIFGDDIRLEELPLPCVVLTFDGGDAVTQTQGITTWLLSANVYAASVYDAADVLDEIEAAGLAFTYDPTLSQALSRFHVTGHERLEPVGPAQRLLAWRVNLETSWLP